MSSSKTDVEGTTALFWENTAALLFRFPRREQGVPCSNPRFMANTPATRTPPSPRPSAPSSSAPQAERGMARHRGPGGARVCVPDRAVFKDPLSLSLSLSLSLN